jgi:hypothetical protein
VQIQAFGAPGEPGDAARIQHLAHLVLRAYEGLLDIAAEVRNQDIPSQAAQAFAIAAQITDLPLAQFRSFVDRTVSEINGVSDYVAQTDPDGPAQRIEVDLSLSIDPGLEAALYKEFKRLRGENV